MNKTVQRCLAVVWLNKPPDRYLPKSIDGGTGWEVWDDKLKRRVPTEDLKSFTFEKITEKVLQ